VGQIKRKKYEALLEPMSEELVEMARWVAETKQRLLVLFEGRDTAGKGGAIKIVADPINPRQCRVVALSKPSEREQAQWYFQRYVSHLPAAGEIVLFDRSWYNRAGVEKVMGFCTGAQVQAFLAAVPSFERLLVEDGIFLIKYWLTCNQARQEERFAERLSDPLKRWKLSSIDLEARQKYAAYTQAREEMLEATHKKEAPWTLVDFNDQRVGRLTLLRDLLDRLPDKKLPVSEVHYPPLDARPKRERFGVVEPIASYPVSEAG